MTRDVGGMVFPGIDAGGDKTETQCHRTLRACVRSPLNAERIQAALDYVGSLPASHDGIRGAVLLTKGRYRIFGGPEAARAAVVEILQLNNATAPAVGGEHPATPGAWKGWNALRQSWGNAGTWPGAGET